MNSEEQTLIDGLFTRLKAAEAQGAPRDPLADARIKEHLSTQPAAAYYMAQAILVQEVALKRLDEQNKQLQAELAQAKSAQPQAAGSGGFLSSIFGNRDTQPAAPTGGGWREPARSSVAPSQAPAMQQPYAQPYAQPGAQAPAGGGFMRGALQTAAGVAGGVMLAEGISSLFHQNQPTEVVNVIEEQASPASDAGSDSGWNDNAEQVTSNDNWDADQDLGFGGDDGGGFADDDSFV